MCASTRTICAGNLHVRVYVHHMRLRSACVCVYARHALHIYMCASIHTICAGNLHVGLGLGLGSYIVRCCMRCSSPYIARTRACVRAYTYHPHPHNTHSHIHIHTHTHTHTQTQTRTHALARTHTHTHTSTRYSKNDDAHPKIGWIENGERKKFAIRNQIVAI